MSGSVDGWIAAAVLWYIVLTIGANHVAKAYDRWITSRDQDAGREFIHTSLLVAAGVTGTEIMRVVRLIPLAFILFGGERMALAVSVWAADAILGYGATGIPMIQGNLERAKARASRAHAKNTELIAESLREIKDVSATDR